ncbi:hypothetical protein H0H93_010998 [Arthromyces matolae]|nr:hypothetical protein H0H93_010998 [Arthromyces matolae]
MFKGRPAETCTSCLDQPSLGHDVSASNLPPHHQFRNTQTEYHKPLYRLSRPYYQNSIPEESYREIGTLASGSRSNAPTIRVRKNYNL